MLTEDGQFRREYALGEISYVWADPNSPAEQVALSALVRAMDSCSEDPSKIKDDGIHSPALSSSR